MFIKTQSFNTNWQQKTKNNYLFKYLLVSNYRVTSVQYINNTLLSNAIIASYNNLKRSACLTETGYFEKVSV